MKYLFGLVGPTDLQPMVSGIATVLKGYHRRNYQSPALTQLKEVMER
jgi:hypothetical protein